MGHKMHMKPNLATCLQKYCMTDVRPLPVQANDRLQNCDSITLYVNSLWISNYLK